jgi:hypothetical protein
MTLLRMLEPDRAAGLRSDLIALFDQGAAGERVVLDRPYILVKGTRREPTVTARRVEEGEGRAGGFEGLERAPPDLSPPNGRSERGTATLQRSR